MWRICTIKAFQEIGGSTRHLHHFRCDVPCPSISLLSWRHKLAGRSQEVRFLQGIPVDFHLYSQWRLQQPWVLLQLKNFSAIWLKNIELRPYYECWHDHGIMVVMLFMPHLCEVRELKQTKRLIQQNSTISYLIENTRRALALDACNKL